MLGTPKVIEIKCEKIGKITCKHERVKRALYPENKDVFDFMLHPPNDEAPVIDSSLLSISEHVATKISNTCIETTEDIEIELNLVAKLLEEFEIGGYELSCPRENFPDIFPLKRVTPAFCPLCY